MPIQVVTPADLNGLKEELIAEFGKLLKEQSGALNDQWIKSAEVMRILHISRGTLQHLRKSRVLPFTKIGGTIYYERIDVIGLLKAGKTPSRKKGAYDSSHLCKA